MPEQSGSFTGRLWIVAGAAAGFLAIAVGAFGAHALRGSLSGHLLDVFQTGARYHLVHAVALVLVGALAPRLSPRLGKLAGGAFLFGIVVFSGSLYLLAVTGLRWLGAITPIGGVALLVGWLALGIGALRRR